MKRFGKKNRASFFRKIFRYPNGLVIGIFIISAIILFRSFVFSGHPPFPGNYLQAWYEPWKSLHFSEGRILLSHKPVAEDVFRHILPFRLLGIDALKRLELPLWNPYNGSGQPLLATLNSGFLDPFNILFALLPAGYADGIYVMLQFVLIALATYLYIRTLGLHAVTAVFAGLTFVLSGFVTIRLIFINYGLAIAMLPLLLAVIEHAVRTRKGGILFVIPIGIALVVVSTQPQIALYILGTVGLCGVMRLGGMYADWKKRLKMVGLFTVLMGLGIALTALQLFPTYELMKVSHITTGNSLDVIEKFFVPFKFLLSIPIPNFYGNTATYNYWGGRSDSIQTASYLGLLPVFLAFVSFHGIKKYRHVHLYFVLLAGISIALAVRWSGSLVFYSLPIPILSTGAPARFFMVTTFALTVLAAIGFEEVYAARKLSKTYLFFVAAFLVSACLLLAHTYSEYILGVKCPMFLPESCRETAFRNTMLAVFVFVPQLIVLSFAPFFARKNSRMRTISVGFVCITVLAAGAYNAYKTLPQSPSVDLFPQVPVISALQTRTRDARVFGLGDAMLAVDLATQFRIFGPQFYHPLYIYRYRELIEYANNGRFISQYPRGDASLKNYYYDNPELIARRDRFLNLDSVKYRLFKKEEVASDPPSGSLVWQDDTWLLLASESALPRAYIATKTIVQSLPSDVLVTLYDPAFDYRHSVVLDHPVHLSASDGFARVMTYDAQEVVVDAWASGTAMLVLTDNDYPGWVATIDNEPVPIYRANYTFRAVRVPEGEHRVVFRYRPMSVRYGLIVSGIAGVLLWVLYRKRTTLLP